MSKCKNFEKCSINQCPYDDMVLERNHIEDEPVCHFWKDRKFREELTEKQRENYISALDQK